MEIVPLLLELSDVQTSRPCVRVYPELKFGAKPAECRSVRSKFRKNEKGTATGQKLVRINSVIIFGISRREDRALLFSSRPVRDQVLSQSRKTGKIAASDVARSRVDWNTFHTP
jgi:hypothetical protein